MTTSNETVGSASEDSSINASPESATNCSHPELTDIGRQEDWDDGLDAYKVSLIQRCAACGSNVLVPTSETAPFVPDNQEGEST